LKGRWGLIGFGVLGGQYEGDGAVPRVSDGHGKKHQMSI
jgi:hypothetical protein